jgi:integrase
MPSASRSYDPTEDKALNYHPLAVATLADVVSAIERNADLKPNRLRDLKSAVMNAARLLDQKPAAIAIDLDALARALDTIEPAVVGLKPKTLQNLRSNLVAAIEASGLRPVLRSVRTALTPEWTAVWATLDEQRLKIGLSRFIKYCAAHGIRPENVDDAAVASFIADFQAKSLVRNIKNLRRQTPRLWNIACETVTDWPGRPLTVSDQRPAPTTVDLTALPLSFQEELAEYLAWCTMADPLDDNARARKLAPISIAGIRSAIKVAVTAAVARGATLESFTALATLVEPSMFQTILRQLNHKAGNEPSFQAHQVARALMGLAREWVKVPAEQLEALKTIKRKLPPLPDGLTLKNKALLRTFDDPALVQALLDLPGKLWRKAQRQARHPKKALVTAQFAILIELLLHMPIRLRNLSNLTFDRHITWLSGNRKRAYLYIPAVETKNSRDYEAEIGPPLAEMLWVYREKIVPAALGRRSDLVVVNIYGNAKSRATLEMQFSALLRKNLGIQMSIHQMRHVMAKLLLDAHPGAHEMVRELLGHSSMRTTRDYYAPIDTKRAVRHHDTIIARMREANAGSRSAIGRRGRNRDRDGDHHD